MEEISLPETIAPGPTKPEIRAILLETLDPGPDEHVVDIGAGTGAVTITMARAASRVTAIERDPERAEAIRTNLDASGCRETVTLRTATAPEGLPGTADAVFVGGTRNLPGVLDWVERADPRIVVVNAVRLETATRAIEGFEDRGFDPTVRRVSIGRGESLAGETAIEPERPVYVIGGRPGGTA